MRIGLQIGYAGKRVQVPMDLIRQAKAANFDSVWISEAWGSDAVSIASWILALTNRIRVGAGRDHANAGAHTGQYGNDRNDTLAAFWKSLYGRSWCFRSPGGGRLARCAI